MNFQRPKVTGGGDQPGPLPPPPVSCHPLYEFPEADIQKTTDRAAYKTEMYILTVLEARSPRSRYWQDWFYGGLFAWLVDRSLLVSSRGLFSGCLSVPVSPSCHIGLWPTSLKTCLQIWSHSETMGVKTSACEFGGT